MTTHAENLYTDEQPNSSLCPGQAVRPRAVRGECVGFALACPAARAALSEQRPSPEHWEQWDYQLDESDARLTSARVALSSPYSTLADLLLDLSHETGVTLEATLNLAPVEIIAFGENSSLRGVMVSLSRMLDAYWVFPRGCAPAARRYLLVPYDTEAEDLARADREEEARQLAYWAGLRLKLESSGSAPTSSTPVCGRCWNNLPPSTLTSERTCWREERSPCH